VTQPDALGGKECSFPPLFRRSCGSNMKDDTSHEQDALDFVSLSPPVWRASTVVFKTLEDFVSRKSRLPDGFTYGTTGTPTQRQLESRIAALDSAQHCVVTPSGQAAICMVLLATVRSGDHLLMTESAYGPAKTFALQHLTALGVDVELYEPRVGKNIESLFRENTRLVWLESPGSVTMELQDIPAIVEAAASRKITTAIDNTWASALGMKPLELGVNISVQACTKYLGGHSDVLMGSISTRDADLYRAIRQLQAVMGQAVSAEDCFLISRGMDTLSVRLRHQVDSTNQIAKFLQGHPLVKKVLLPSLNTSPDRLIWERDFSGSGSLFSVELTTAPLSAYTAMFGEFRHFAIGASWGGVHSIAAFYPKEEISARRYRPCDGPLVRLSIGLENANDLIEELDTALQAFEKAIPS